MEPGDATQRVADLEFPYDSYDALDFELHRVVGRAGTDGRWSPCDSTKRVGTRRRTERDPTRPRPRGRPGDGRDGHRRREAANAPRVEFAGSNTTVLSQLPVDGGGHDEAGDDEEDVNTKEPPRYPLLVKVIENNNENSHCAQTIDIRPVAC